MRLHSSSRLQQIRAISSVISLAAFLAYMVATDFFRNAKQTTPQNDISFDILIKILGEFFNYNYDYKTYPNGLNITGNIPAIQTIHTNSLSSYTTPWKWQNASNPPSFITKEDSFPDVISRIIYAKLCMTASQCNALVSLLNAAAGIVPYFLAYANAAAKNIATCLANSTENLFSFNVTAADQRWNETKKIFGGMG